MTSDIRVFKNNGFGSIRVFEENGEVWFVASDVAKALGYREAEKMTRYLSKDERGTRKAGSSQVDGVVRRVTTINEPGFYHALNMRRTACMKDPEARARVEGFQRWVNHEVLPSIRRNGAYINPAGAESFEDLMARALQAADEVLARRERRIKALQAENEAMQPKGQRYFFNKYAGEKRASYSLPPGEEVIE